MLNKMVLSSIATLSLVGCSQELSEEDSRVGFAAVSSVLATGVSMAQSSASATSVVADETPAFRAEGSANVDFNFNCPGGGTARFVGSAAAAGDPSAAAGTFSLSTTFSGCKSALNVTIDGDLDYEATASATGDSAQLSFSMVGSLSFSGEVDGSCDIDVKISASASPGSASGTYQGSICGHDASATANVQG